MPPVPSLPGERIVRALERVGFKVARVTGSHHIMRHSDGRGTTVPVHQGRDVAIGTLRGILSDVGMSAWKNSSGTRERYLSPSGAPGTGTTRTAASVAC
jgi:predicted RNA binding protein YcfA (HicA-like mRNA interferase family)